MLCKADAPAHRVKHKRIKCCVHILPFPQKQSVKAFRRFLRAKTDARQGCKKFNRPKAFPPRRSSAAHAVADCCHAQPVKLTHAAAVSRFAVPRLRTYGAAEGDAVFLPPAVHSIQGKFFYAVCNTRKLAVDKPVRRCLLAASVRFKQLGHLYEHIRKRIQLVCHCRQPLFIFAVTVSGTVRIQFFKKIIRNSKKCSGGNKRLRNVQLSRTGY